MHTDLWTFSLAVYAHPGVEDACLHLETEGADVCLLLCAAWLDRHGVVYEPQRLGQLQQIAQPWQEEVVQPLRQLRTQWKPAAMQDVELNQLRERIKALELEAEQQLLLRLQALTQGWPRTEALRPDAWLEECATRSASLNRDALRLLHVAAASV